VRYRNLYILALVTVVVIVAAAISSYFRAPTTDKKKEVLFPGLEKQINNISEVEIQDRDNTLNLVKQKDGWAIRQADNYPALFSKVKPLIINTAGLEIIEKKTSTPALYPRLGVEGLQSKGSTSHLLTLKDASGKTLASLIVGKKQEKGAPGAEPGVYVRRPDDKQSLLVEGNLLVSSRASDWFKKNLFSIEPDRIESVVIKHPGGQEVSLSRIKGKDKFELNSVPKGREPQSDVILYRMGNVLEDVYAQNIKSRDHYAFLDDHVTTTVRTFDGLIANIEAASADGRNYVHYSFQVDESKLPAAAKDSKDNDKNTAKVKNAAAAKDAAKQPDIRKEAEDYNKEMSGWVYTIPEFKYELLVETLDQLTKPKVKGKDKKHP
jgi:predicted  nucleic acid-binding Zn-ribbon protein